MRRSNKRKQTHNLRKRHSGRDNRTVFSSTVRQKVYIDPQGPRYSRVAIILISCLSLVCVLPIIVALYDIQIKQHEPLSQEAISQYYYRQVDQPIRGNIYDRNGKLLATTNYVYTVGISPKHLYSLFDRSLKPELIADKLAEFLGLSADKLLEEMAKKEEPYIQLVKNLPADKAKSLAMYLDQEAIGGVKLDPVAQRVYTNGYLASQVLGFASAEDNVLVGRMGLEYSFNDYLTGRPGFSYGAHDNFTAQGNLPFTSAKQESKSDGYNIYTTYDSTIQDLLQAELEKAMVAYQPKKHGMAMVIDVNTGELLAMASYPYFKSSEPSAEPRGYEGKKWQADSQEAVDYLQQEVWRNKNISDLYEPGSTFKVITAAMALEENITNEANSFSDNPIDVEDRTIYCWSGGGHGVETFEEAFIRSCNPIFVQVALDLGRAKFYDYVHAFGYYNSTGIDLPGEASCMFHQEPSVVDLANLSFGEQSTVTPLHQLLAIAASANGGKLLTPRIVGKITDSDDKIIKSFGPEVKRRVVSENSSARIKHLMEQMVNYSATSKYSYGYRVGGKTSTATDELTGETTLSFVELAPIDNPRIACLMVLQEPQIDPGNSGIVMRSVLDVTDRILEYMGFERTYTAGDLSAMAEVTEMPDLIGMTFSQATRLLAPYSISIKDPAGTLKPEDKLLVQEPAAGTVLYKGSQVYAYGESNSTIDKVKMIDFTGKNFNEAITAANQAGLIVNFWGPLDGQVTGQEDPSGQHQALKRGSIISLTMEKTTESGDSGN